MLATSDAVAAIIRLEDGRFLMQLRDERPDIWYPGHWGCFGGAVNVGETAEQALKRELREELEYSPHRLQYVTRFDFDFGPLGLKPCYRIYYLVTMAEQERRRLVLHEGAAVRPFSAEQIRSHRRVAPYDAFAITVFLMSERRLAGLPGPQGPTASGRKKRVA